MRDLVALLRFRSVLPRSVWNWIARQFWKRFWRETAEREGAERELSGSERATLTERIADCFPFARVLEVGAGFGQNFHVLAALFPGVQFLGIERQDRCVAQGVELLQAQGLRNVTLAHGDAAVLDRFEAKSFDLVYSSAALLYVSASEIDQVASEMLRLAKRQIVLLEQHLVNSFNPEQDKGVFFLGNGNIGFWLRDYERLFARLCPSASIQVEKIRYPLWQTERWKDLAHLITIELPKS